MAAQALREDFRLDATAGAALLHALTTGGLLQSEGGSAGEYRLTERFQEFAQARVVAPLDRADAKQLVDQACRLAAKVNADWTWNPVTIEIMAVSGDYMSRHDKIGDLTLWPVVKTRPQVRPRRLRAPMTKADGSAEIRAALRALNWFIVVHLVTDTASVERPFSVPFRAYDDVIASPLATARLRDWSSSIRRQLTGS
ncbi:MAG: hypothetical protein ABI900_03845 [Betaproteobacteria bacterium]